jgi:aspartyl-tRNA synthetase
MGAKQLDWQRTTYCGRLRLEHQGQEVTLLGWVHRHRDLGNLVFVDLRDREGLIQLVFPSGDKELLKEAKKIRAENVLAVKGVVRRRAAQARNPELPTGEVEVEAKALRLLSTAEVPPFVIADAPQASEELRFKYRYLDMRRPSLQRNIRLRHQTALRVRNFLSENGFLEIETPFLTKSTPEGARDYLVPSRMYKGRFYALPQSPQLFKQILMIAGFDRYFQIVRCFRDEDLRADRQPEFTQIDIEMSFVSEEDIFGINEGLMAAAFALVGAEVERPFTRLTYQDSMEKYGTDKPDLRLGMEIQDLTELGPSLDSEIIRNALSSGGVLKGLKVEGEGSLPRSRLDKINQKAQELGAEGVIWIRIKDGFKSSLKMGEEGMSRIWKNFEASRGDLILLVADKREITLRVLGEIRNDFLTQKVEVERVFKFVWVTDFPLFERSEEEARLVSMHHPFTSPHEEDLELLEKEPLRVRARAYDLVLNGVEIGGGSIRISDLKLQRRVFQVLGLNERDVKDKFGFFLEALRYGVPPHGGIAFGFDRIVMILAGEESIREVIPFPKTTSALCLLTGSPAEVDERQLQELGLKKTKK